MVAPAVRGAADVLVVAHKLEEFLELRLDLIEKAQALVVEIGSAGGLEDAIAA